MNIEIVLHLSLPMDPDHLSNINENFNTIRKIQEEYEKDYPPKKICLEKSRSYMLTDTSILSVRVCKYN